MTEHRSSRTIVKSPPELWAECSDPQSLARHLGSVGEIRITRLDPESTVAWEGAAACGTVAIEPAGWGTRVTLTMTATQEQAQAADEEVPEADDVEVPEPSAPAAPKPRGLARLFAWRRSAERAPEPVATAPEPEQTRTRPAPAGPQKEPASDPLAAALDSLGRAHHRPYSRP